MPMLVLVIVIQVVLPAYLAYDVWRSRDETRGAWFLRASTAATYFGLLFLTGRWDWVGYLLRFWTPAVFALAAAAGYLRMRDAPWLVDGRPGAPMSILGNAVPLLFFAGLLVHAVSGRWYEGEAVHLSSPLRGGAFYVGQGGDSPLTNAHNTHRTQRYAMDILELNEFGARAASLYSSDLDRYVIFGQPVHSPCDGRIVAAVDGLADNIPPQSDRTVATGNHVVVACNDVRVFLAHLQRDSVSVRSGTAVAAGDLVGRVGNSGNTSEPHLHVHAVRSDTDGTDRPVPIVLDGVFAVRNTVLAEVE